MDPPTEAQSQPSEDPGAVTSCHVRHAIAGDVQSLGWVVARLSPLLLAQASYRLGPVLRTHCDPEDLVNDAWLVALPKLAELPAREGRHTPVLLRFLSTTLLYKINNLAKKHLRGEPVREAAASASGTDPIARLPSDASGVVTQAVRHERQHAVTTCLEELEPEDREVILLRGIEQLPNKTAAVLLDLTPEAVAMRFHRALKKLRARLPGSVFDELGDD